MLDPVKEAVEQFESDFKLAALRLLQTRVCLPFSLAMRLPGGKVVYVKVVKE